MKHLATAARARNTHDTGFVAPEPSCESTAALEMTLAEYRAMPKRAPRNRHEEEMQEHEDETSRKEG